MFWNKKPAVKHGILFKFTFDGVKMNDEVEAGTPEEISRRITLIKANPDAERYKIQQRWILSEMPLMTLRHISHTRGDIHIQAEVTLTHTTQHVKPRLNSLQILIRAALIWIAFSAFVTATTIYNLGQQQTKDPDCIIWENSGTPYKLVVDTTEYKVNPDGTLPLETRAFLNPWHRQLIDSGQCERRNR